MVKVIILLVAAFLVSNANAGAIYKCKEPGEFGDVVWTNSPCNTGKEVERRETRDYSREDQSKKGHGKFTAKKASELIRFRRIAVGMSKKDVLKSWGQPADTNITLSQSGKTEQLVYGTFPDNTFVYINEKGDVSSIQYSKVKEKKAKPKTGLGTVRTGGYGQYNKL